MLPLPNSNNAAGIATRGPPSDCICTQETSKSDEVAWLRESFAKFLNKIASRHILDEPISGNSWLCCLGALILNVRLLERLHVKP